MTDTLNTDPRTQLSLDTRYSPLSPGAAQIRRNINMTPTSSRHSFQYNHHPSPAVNTQLSDHDSPVKYFKSPTHDKISDYEDIWEKSPIPDHDLMRTPTSDHHDFIRSPSRTQEFMRSPSRCHDIMNSPTNVHEYMSSPLHDHESSPAHENLISPTISEQRFKQFLFNKVFDKNSSSESHFETDITEEEFEEEIPFTSDQDPSYPTCSSSEIISSSDTNIDHDSSSLSSSSFCSDLSDEEDDDLSDEPSDPLEALENLTDYNTDNDIDDLEIADNDDKTDLQKKVNDSSFTSSENEDKSIASKKVSDDNMEAFNNVSEEEEHIKTSTSGSLTGLLRKLSIRRRSSFSKSRKQSMDKRLSAVIGCYLTPTLLGIQVNLYKMTIKCLIFGLLVRMMIVRLTLQAGSSWIRVKNLDWIILQRTTATAIKQGCLE